MSSRRFACTAMLAVSTNFIGCGGRIGRPASEADVRAERATAALAMDDFTAAQAELSWLASLCYAGTARTTALLLLAALELDPTNPAGSPRDAARTVTKYFRASGSDDSWTPFARTLYRIAADQGGLDGAEAPAGPLVGAPSCERSAEIADPLPSLPAVTAFARARVLAADLSGLSDSIAVLTRRADSLAAHTSALQAELDRIGTLLREGATPLPTGSQRR
jgi:hypothetical protein